MELNKKNTTKIILILFSTVAFCIGLINLGTVWGAILKFFKILTPVILGLCIAFVLDPLVMTLETKMFGSIAKRNPKSGKSAARGLGIFASLIIVSGIIALLLLLVIPEIEEALTILANTLPGTIANLINSANDLLARYEVDFRIPTGKLSEWTDLLVQAKEYIQNAFESGALSNIANTALSVLSGFAKFLVGLILSIYVLMQKEKIELFISRFIKAYLSERVSSRIFRVATITKVSFRNYVTGQLTEAMILGMLCFIGMLIFRFPYPTATSAVVGIMALIPIFGAWIGGILGALLSLSQSFTKALLFVLFLIILQQIEGNLIYPRVVGKSVGLPGILVLISVMIGASIGGVLGMILAVPVCSILSVLIKESVDKRLSRKNAANNLEKAESILSKDI